MKVIEAFSVFFKLSDEVFCSLTFMHAFLGLAESLILVKVTTAEDVVV